MSASAPPPHLPRKPHLPNEPDARHLPPARVAKTQGGSAGAGALPDVFESTLLAPFPVLSSSQFCLELMTQGKALDLRQTADLLGRDPGAVLRIFSTIGREFPNPADRPERLDECIMSMDSVDLVVALHTPAFSRREQVAMVSFARHAHLISRYCLPVAASLGIDENDAQLVGLLHALHEFPMALGRIPLSANGAASAGLGVAIARRHHLPQKIAEAVHATEREDPSSVWVALIQAAHDLASSAGNGAAYLRGSSMESGI